MNLKWLFNCMCKILNLNSTVVLTNKSRPSHHIIKEWEYNGAIYSILVLAEKKKGS